MTRKEQLEAVLNELVDSMGGEVVAAVLATPEGKLITSVTGRTSVKGNRFAAMGATILATAKKMGKLVEAGAAQEATVKLEGELFYIKQAGPKAILVVVVREGAFIGLLEIEMERAAERVEEVLG
ncbi:roadblock/LC7 domain-containing protein [Thermovibrio ammonificans]